MKSFVINGPSVPIQEPDRARFTSAHPSARELMLCVLLAVYASLMACSATTSDKIHVSVTSVPQGTVSTATPNAWIDTSVISSTQPDSVPTVTLKHPGMALDINEGDFWDFRWEQTDRSCAQGSGCNADSGGGLFRVTLGAPRVIDGVEMFRVVVTGDHFVDDGSVDMAPGWAYIGVDGPLLLGSSANHLVTLFDARTGEWTGGGFFSRFNNSETHAASAISIDSSHRLAEMEGFRTGSAISVVRSDSESMCEVIEGRRICPRDQAFSVTEAQYYRDGVGPLGYTYTYSASFSGGGFFSSSSSDENVALVASSLLGDTPVALADPTSTPGPVSHEMEIVLGPESGTLYLDSWNNEIPDFETGVLLTNGVAEVTFVNPDVGDDNWSYGITFRHSEEETFHAVYVTGKGTWEHFARGGSLESQVSLGSGTTELNKMPGEENRLAVVFGATVGELYVNGVLVAELGFLSGLASAAGDVRVITGVLATDVFTGAEVVFRDLLIRSPQ